MFDKELIDPEQYPLLSRIDSPQDLRALARELLPQLCREIRAFLISSLSVHPGHFASSLGAVDLTVALHYVYITPYDKLVWDVGHQAYAHKLLTGRAGSFHSLRQKDGIGGFPSPSESPYDTFPAGHASNSISAALGMAVAACQKGEEREVIAVIGDGSMTGGLAFEGLNNASSQPNNMLVVLNDNNMSIDRNVGGLNKYLVDVNTSQTYNSVRHDLYRGLKRINLIGETGRRNIQRFNNSLKSLLTRGGSCFFEGLSIRYFGPVDGNDVLRIVDILLKIKDMKGPKLLHLRTQKGYGYEPALANPTTWHAPGRFDPDTGERLDKTTEGEPPKFQDVFGHTLVELAEQDERIVGITPAMPSGCSMTHMIERFPDRAYDVGIAEGHAVTFSAGLASQGLIPFCNIYSSFAQRSLDQIIHDVCLPSYHVVFCLDRAGLVGEDGATHQGAFDLSYLRFIPQMTIAAPMDEHYLRHLMYTAYKGQAGPMAIRYPRGRGSQSEWRVPMQMLPIGKGRCLRHGSKIAVLSLGPIGVEVREALDTLEQETGLCCTHYDMVFLKPLDTAILDQATTYDGILTVEENSLIGGLGSAVIEELTDRGYRGKIKRLGIPDTFIPHASVKEQRAMAGISREQILATLRQFIEL